MAQRSSNPTVAEKVGRGAIAEPRVRAYGYTEYDERRPGYVSSNPRAGAEWGALANALDGFYKSSTRAYTKYKENQIETGIANSSIATDFARETYGEQANKMAFKELVEKHPELANDNPWVEVGYEQARLRELGMEAKRGLGKYLDETGAFNSEDPAAFQQSVNTFFKEFREQAGVNSYEDKILVAKWFSPVEAETKKLASNQYETIRKAGRQDKLANQTSSNIATHIKLALDEGRPIDFLALGAELKMATDNGLLNIKAQDTMLNGLKIAVAQTDDLTEQRQIVDLAKEIEIDGIRVIDTPEGAKWADVELTKIISAENKLAKKDEKDSKKFYGKYGESLVYAYAYATEEQYANEDEIIADYENRTGQVLSLQQRHEFLTDIRKIKDAREKNVKALNEGSVDIIVTTTHIDEIIRNSASNDEAAVALFEAYGATGDEKYLKKANALIGDTNKELFKGLSAVHTNAAKELNTLSVSVGDAYIASVNTAGIVPSLLNKTDLQAVILKAAKRVHAEVFASAYDSYMSDGSKRSMLEATKLAEADAQKAVQERAGRGEFIKDIKFDDYVYDPMSMPQYLPFIPKDTPKPVAYKIAQWVDTSNSWVTSPQNKILRQVPLSEHRQILDLERMATEGADVTSVPAILSYLKFPEGVDIPSRALSADGKTLMLHPRTDISKDIGDNIEANLIYLFPSIKEVSIYAPKPVEYSRLLGY